MNFVVRNIERTCLNSEAYVKLLRKFGVGIENDVVISFDLRLKNYGSYRYNSSKKKHIILISPTECKKEEDVKLSSMDETYNLISTTLHELKHAMQQEELKAALWSKKYSCAKHVRNPLMAEFYSVSEVDARVFENKSLLSAVEFYNSCCK